MICQETAQVIAMVSNKEGSNIAYAIEISSLKEVWKQLHASLIKEKSIPQHEFFYNNLNKFKDKIKEKTSKKKKEKELVRKQASPLKYYLSGIFTIISLFLLYYFFKPSPPFPDDYKVVNISSSETLNVREETGTVYKILGELPYNAKNIIVASCEKNDAAKKWCNIQYGSLKGWVRAKYIAIDREDETTNAQEGFYNISLNQLFFQVNYPTSIKANEKVMLSAILKNRGATSKVGGINLSFPQRPLLDYTIDYSNFDSIKTYKIGTKIYNHHKNQNRKMSAIHPLIEAEGNNWRTNTIKSFAITLTPPKDVNVFKIRIRASLGLKRLIPQNGVLDQQGFESKEIVIPIVK